MEVVGLPLDAEHQALLVSIEDMAVEGALLCVRSAADLECAATSIDYLEGVVARAAWGWLLVGSSSYGNPRDDTRLLIAVRHTRRELFADTLGLGGVSGDGHACDTHDGYCVDMSGMAYRAQVLSPTCASAPEPVRAGIPRMCASTTCGSTSSSSSPRAVRIATRSDRVGSRRSTAGLRRTRRGVDPLDEEASSPALQLSWRSSGPRRGCSCLRSARSRRRRARSGRRGCSSDARDFPSTRR